MEIYLIRHTTPHIEKGICYGQSDVPLANSFENEWQALKDKLPIAADVLFSSPLSRCLALASKLGVHYRLPVIQNDRLKELNFGDWEMKQWNDIDATSLQQWMNDYINVKCPNGESYLDLAERVQLFLMHLRTEAPSKVIIVTHHGAMKAMHSILNNVDLKKGMEQKFEFAQPYLYKV